MSISEIAARLGGWPRRVLAVVCLLLAVAAALTDRPARPTTAGGPVVVAAYDLAPGTRLRAADLRVRSWPAGIRPPNVISNAATAVGRRITGAMRHDEALTTTRLAGADLTAGLPPGRQAVPVEITGPATASLVRVGDDIDLLMGGAVDSTTSAPASVLAEGLRVLAVVPVSTAPGIGDATVELVVGADRATALRIAAASGRPVLATLRNPP